MSPSVWKKLQGCGGAQIGRRDFLFFLPALALVPRSLLQGSNPPIRPTELNHVTCAIRDSKRSLDFYQGLFGIPVSGRQGALFSLRVGSGFSRFALSPGGPNVQPGIGHFCVSVENFNVEKLMDILAEHGVKRPAPAGRGGGGAAAAGGPLTMRVRMRGPENGGAPEGTAEFYVTDPDGISVQLQDKAYCGGNGPLGNICGGDEPTDKKGLLALREMRQVAFTVSNLQRSVAWYQALFGMPMQTRQGSSPVLSLRSGPQSLVLTESSAPPRITHVVFVIENFDPDRAQNALATFNVRPTGTAAIPSGPLASSVVMRGDTPQLFFADADGILIQLQDVSYCGGTGRLGNVCG